MNKLNLRNQCLEAAFSFTEIATTSLVVQRSIIDFQEAFQDQDTYWIKNSGEGETLQAHN
jgi:hypothetical protein